MLLMITICHPTANLVIHNSNLGERFFVLSHQIEIFVISTYVR